MEAAAAAARVASIMIYPIKSCGGISVSEAPLTSTGLRYDREWVVVNGKGRAFTQRVEPKLALVHPKIPFYYKPNDNDDNDDDDFLSITAPGMEILKVPLNNNKAATLSDGISVWEWSGSALDEGPEAANWFSTYLGKPARLVRFHQSSEVRPVDPHYAPGGFNTTFSDGYPFLLLSQGSLDALNALLKDPVPVNRFRPNILVDGCEPFAEDLWKEIKINKLTFDGVKLCSRCKVPTVNQETGIGGGSEPTETLMKFRSDKVLRPNKKQQGKVYFGQNMVCRESLLSGGNGKSIIKVGDPINVVKMISSRAEAAA